LEKMKKKAVGRTMVKTSKNASNVCVLRNKHLAYSNNKLSEEIIKRE